MQLLNLGFKVWKKLFNQKRKKNQQILINNIDREYVRDLVYFWNANFPLDRWYRKKYNLAFNSTPHREVSILDIKFEWEENILINKISEINEEYKMNKGSFLKKISQNNSKSSSQVTDEMVEEWMNEFKDIDLSKYDD